MCQRLAFPAGQCRGEHSGSWALEVCRLWLLSEPLLPSGASSLCHSAQSVACLLWVGGVHARMCVKAWDCACAHVFPVSVLVFPWLL